MNIVVLGMGLMGPTVAKDCVKDKNVEKVIGLDFDEAKLNDAKSYVDDEKFTAKKVDITNHKQLVEALIGNNVVVNCTAAKFSLNVLDAAMEAKVNVLDMAGEGIHKMDRSIIRSRKRGLLLSPAVA